MLNTDILTHRSTIENYLRQYQFLDTTTITQGQKEIVLTALVHKSYAADFVPVLDHNERLEFLGDAVLGASIGALLFDGHPERSEAQMTLYKIALVREEMLAQVAREIGLGTYIFISHGEEGQGGRDKDVILADTLEALLGACYQVQGFEHTKQRIASYILTHLDELQATDCKSYKSLLQEWAQQHGYPIPEYTTIQHTPHHDEGIVFEASVIINEQITGVGVGKNKKKAQESAARAAYEKI